MDQLTQLQARRIALAAQGFQPASAGVAMRASTTVKLEGTPAEQMLKLAELLEDLDDVQSVSANFDISEAEMERMST